MNVDGNRNNLDGNFSGFCIDRRMIAVHHHFWKVVLCVLCITERGAKYGTLQCTIYCLKGGVGAALHLFLKMFGGCRFAVQHHATSVCSVGSIFPLLLSVRGSSKNWLRLCFLKIEITTLQKTDNSPVTALVHAAMPSF